jgi:hypothetical protein
MTIAEHSARFARQFPDFPALVAFIAKISSSATPFRDLIPKEQQATSAGREPYMRALIWLLREDLVVQVHTRARIFARPEIKVKAYLALWHRRRGRWLALKEEENRAGSNSAVAAVRTPEMDETDLVTPKASDHLNPMDTQVGRTDHPGLVEPNTTGSSPRMKALDLSPTDYDSELEMDSDLGEGEETHERGSGGGGGGTGTDLEEFSMDVLEPDDTEIPAFTASFIFKPAKAQKDEARWLRVIRERAEGVWASKFDL